MLAAGMFNSILLSVRLVFLGVEIALLALHKPNDLRNVSMDVQGCAAGEEGALLLLVISNAASKFPADQAASLAKDLVKVGN